MIQKATIPKDEQLEALANGLQQFYRLIEKYTGGAIQTDFRQFATVTKAELTEYLRRDEALAKQHVMSEEEALRLHDHPVLLADNDKWMVCWIDRGTKTNIVYYDNLPEATANFLMAYW